MSWWNTSNLSDFASKALKNAQKTIDKALDIEEHQKAASKAKDEATAKETPKSKADFWSAWSTPGDGAESSNSSWSLPWGGGAEAEQEAESVFQEKTAEEIKSEVLKAAKERTKAKSKLFPKSSKKLIPEESNPTALVKEKVPESRPDKQETKEHVKDLSPNIRSIESLDLETSQVVADHDEFLGENESSIEANPSLEDRLTAELTETIQVSETNTALETGFKESDFRLQSSPVPEQCPLEGSQIEDIKDTTQENIDEEILKSETSKDLQSAQSTEEKGTINNQVVEITEQDSVACETDEPTEEIPASCVDDSKDSCNELLDPNAYNPDTVADISSSVEFVTDKDISNIPETASSDTYTAVEAEDVCADQSGSDPEIIDCDKADGDNDIGAQIVEESDTDVNTETKCVEESEVVGVTETQTVSQTYDICLEHAVASKDDTEECKEDVAETNVEKTNTSGTDGTVPSSESESSMTKLDTSLETSASEDTLVEAQSPYCVKAGDSADDGREDIQFSMDVDIKEDLTDDTELETDVTGGDAHTTEVQDNDGMSSNEDNKDDLSPANSFVKCMLEDAIEEGKVDDNCDSLSGNSKSDGSRSIYSNHESSDEIDTTTSSDIEIISLPTPNGDSKLVSQLDPVPLRIALQKTSWRGSPTHKRTDSSDSSNASKDGCELSPGRDGLDYHEYHRTHHEHADGSRICELPPLSEEDDNPYHPQRLLNDENKAEMPNEPDAIRSHDLESCDQVSHDSQPDMQQKLAEMSEVLQAREAKLLQLSKDNCDLMETNSILNNQLKQSEEARESEMTDVNELTAEFTARLTDAEKRNSSAIREKESLKKQLQEAQSELTRGDSSMKQLLEDKDEQIAGLLQEGEKLSKSQLQSNTIIKKLRQKEKDNESTMTSQKKQLDKQKEELENLHKVLESKEELEKKQTEAISQLSAAVNKQEQEMVKLKSEHEDSMEKARGLQVALDNSYKEMAELHRNTAVMDSKAQEAALSAEMQVREELKMTIEKQTQQHKWEKDSLVMQVEDMRLSMARQEKDHNRREDLLKQEIGDLQKQMQEDEARTQELTQGVSLATRPLLRQIENLQANFNAQSSTWERVEKNLTDRLGETQTNLAVALENERTASEKVMDLESRVTSLETQNSRLRQEKSTLSAQLDALKAKVQIAEDAKQSEAAQLEVLKQQMSKEITELKKQTVLYETQLDMEKSKLEQEKKKVSMLQEQIRDLERECQRSKSRGTPTPVRQTPSPVSVSRQDSMVSSIHEHSFSAITQEELDRSFILSTPNGNKQSLYEALRQSGASNLLENLQSQLKMREGEISHLQGEIRSLERTRESMARELVDLSNKNDELEEKVKDMPQLQQQYSELDGRYNAMLQMYGEKVEEAEELKMDLQDVKDMYKAQINQLLSQSS